MNDLTRVSAYRDLDQAAYWAGKYRGLGFHVVVAGPTDAVRLDNGENTPALWESGQEADWYIVLASKASLDIIANEKK